LDDLVLLLVKPRYKANSQHQQRGQNLNMYNQRLVYLHENPVRAGFVREPQEWLYSSAIDYYIPDGKGLLNLAGLD
jgi:hypothetical protein